MGGGPSITIRPPTVNLSSSGPILKTIGGGGNGILGEIGGGGNGILGTINGNPANVGAATPVTSENAESELSKVTMDQWNEFKNTAWPMIEKLTDQYAALGKEAGNVAPSEQILAARGISKSQFDNATGVMNRNIERFGIGVNDEQRADVNRKLSLAGVMGAVDASNKTRQNLISQRDQIATGAAAGSTTTL